MASDEEGDFEEDLYDPLAAYESAEERPLTQSLRELGIGLPRPEVLNEAEVSAKLWEVIHGLARLGVFLHSTDHLSDRELYTELWEEILPEPTVILPDDPDFAQHIDLVSSGSPEDLHLYLKHYAGEEVRQDWMKNYPEDDVPEHEDPPYDRDRHLPQREFSGEEEPVM